MRQQNYWNPTFKEVVKFAAGFFGERLVKQIYPVSANDDVINGRLLLAAECTGSIQISLELEDRLVNALQGLCDDKSPFSDRALAALVKMKTRRSLELAWKLLSEERNEIGYYRYSLDDPALIRLLFTEDRFWATLAEVCEGEKGWKATDILRAWLPLVDISPNILNDLCHQLSDGTKAKGAISALEALSSCLDDSHLKTILAKISEVPDEIRWKVVFLLSSHTNRLERDDLCGILRQLEETATTEIDTEILRLLAECGKQLSGEDIDKIIALLDHPDEKVVEWVCYVLQRISCHFDDSHTRKILPKLWEAKWERLCTALAYAVADKISSHQFQDIYERINSKRTEIRVRAAQLFWALTEHLSQEQIAYLVSCINSIELTRHIVSIALKVYDKLTDSQAIQVLDKLLDEKKEVQIEIISLIDRLKVHVKEKHISAIMEIFKETCQQEKPAYPKNALDREELLKGNLPPSAKVNIEERIKKDWQEYYAIKACTAIAYKLSKKQLWYLMERIVASRVIPHFIETLVSHYIRRGDEEIGRALAKYLDREDFCRILEKVLMTENTFKARAWLLFVDPYRLDSASITLLISLLKGDRWVSSEAYQILEQSHSVGLLHSS